MTVTALRVDGVIAESADLRRDNLTVWLSAKGLTEWSGTPVQAFEIPRSMLVGATVVDQPRGHRNAVALAGSLHGRYVRWIFPNTSPEVVHGIKAWVDGLETDQ